MPSFSLTSFPGRLSIFWLKNPQKVVPGEAARYKRWPISSLFLRSVPLACQEDFLYKWKRILRYVLEISF